MTRRLIKHLAQPVIYAVDVDDDGMVLGALDVTTEVTSGGLCSHLLESLPLVGRLDDVEYLNAHRDEYEPYATACGNIHHLMRDLLRLEADHRAAKAAFRLTDARAKALRRDVDARAAEVHALLDQIAERKPLPLFEDAADAQV